MLLKDDLYKSGEPWSWLTFMDMLVLNLYAYLGSVHLLNDSEAELSLWIAASFFIMVF